MNLSAKSSYALVCQKFIDLKIFRNFFHSLPILLILAGCTPLVTEDSAKISATHTTLVANSKNLTEALNKAQAKALPQLSLSTLSTSSGSGTPTESLSIGGVGG